MPKQTSMHTDSVLTHSGLPRRLVLRQISCLLTLLWTQRDAKKAIADAAADVVCIEHVWEHI